MTADSKTPLGLPAAQARNLDGAVVIYAIERVGDDSLVSFGKLPIMLSGRLGQIGPLGTVRLTLNEREALIAQLMDHRFADITAEGGVR